jgi:hypothetical protein
VKRRGVDGQSFAHCRRLKNRKWQEGVWRTAPHKNVARAWIQQLQALDGVGRAHAPAPIKARLRKGAAATGGGSRTGLEYHASVCSLQNTINGGAAAISGCFSRQDHAEPNLEEAGRKILLSMLADDGPQQYRHDARPQDERGDDSKDEPCQGSPEPGRGIPDTFEARLRKG